MKKAILAAFAVCAIFASCSNDDDAKREELRDIRIQFPSNVAGPSRTTEAPVIVNADTKTTITNATVFLLNGNSVLTVTTMDPAEIETGKDILDVSSSVDNVVVVGNVPTTVQDDVAALRTLADIENYAYLIATQANSATVVGVANKLHMGSSNNLLLTDPIDGRTNEHFSVEVDIYSITGRFEFGDVIAGEGVLSVKLEGIWINNYTATYADATSDQAVKVTNDNESIFWITIPPTNIKGSTIDLSPASMENPYAPDFYYDAGDPRVTNDTPPPFAYAYHLFAGNYMPTVVMLVSGQYDDGYFNPATGSNFLGFVTFTTFFEGATPITMVEGNKIYKAFGGITINSVDITSKPELPLMDLTITVNVTPWTEVNVTPGV